MRDVIVLGLDIHGKECAGLITRAGSMNLLGYISQYPEYPESFGGYPVLGCEDAIDNYPDAGLIPLHVWKSYQHINRWVSLIDSSVFVSATAQIGKGCIIYPQCFIGADAVLGDGVLMLSGGIVNHDCKLGDRATLTSHATLAGSVNVGEGAYLGQSCTIRQNLNIGKNAFVGTGAVVIKDVPDNTTVAGNPAKPLQKK